jgi:hypothetical protein
VSGSCKIYFLVSGVHRLGSVVMKPFGSAVLLFKELFIAVIYTYHYILLSFTCVIV